MNVYLWRPLFFCFAAAVALYAQEPKKPVRCYWIGSSSSPVRLLKTFDDFVNAGQGFCTTGSVRGETVRLDWIAGGDPKARPVQFKGVQKGEFDFVIIQVSMGFVRSQAAMDGMEAVITDVCCRVRELGAEPVLWEAYAATPDQPSGMDTVRMQAALYGQLMKAAVKNNARFVPAGSAWQEVRMTRPDDRLYMFSQRAPHDLGHTGPRGNFILGAAIYAAVTGENPQENPNLNTYDLDASGQWSTAELFVMEPEEARQFKATVWQHECKAREEYKALAAERSQPAASR